MIKKLAIAILICYAGVVVYANARYRNPSKDLQPVQIQAFEVNGLDSSAVDVFCDQLKSDDRITAVSFNRKEQLVSVSYHYQLLSKEELMIAMSKHGDLSIKQKSFPEKASCPVHGYLAVWDKFLEFHTF